MILGTVSGWEKDQLSMKKSWQKELAMKWIITILLLLMKVSMTSLLKHNLVCNIVPVNPRIYSVTDWIGVQLRFGLPGFTWCTPRGHLKTTWTRRVSYYTYRSYKSFYTRCLDCTVRLFVLRKKNPQNLLFHRNRNRFLCMK